MASPHSGRARPSDAKSRGAESVAPMSAGEFSAAVSADARLRKQLRKPGEKARVLELVKAIEAEELATAPKRAKRRGR